MIETLTIHIPFSKDEFLRANLFRLKLAHRPSWRKAIGSIIFTGLFSLLTIFLYLTDQQNPVFLILTIVFCLVTILIVNGIVEARKKYLKKLNELGTTWEEKKMDCTFEFNDEGIHYSDKEKTMNFKWTVFKNCLSNSNYIIFMTEDSFDRAYFLSRRQIESDSWRKILEIASTKLKVKTMIVD